MPEQLALADSQRSHITNIHTTFINSHTIHIMQHTTIPTAYRIARLCQFRRETSFLHFKKSGKEGINNLLHFYKLTLNRQKAKQQTN